MVCLRWIRCRFYWKNCWCGKIDGVRLRRGSLAIFGTVKRLQEWCLAWKLLLDRIPTRMNLAIGNIILVEVSVNCALCDCDGETSQHLFLFCEVSSNVWSLVMRWLDFLLLRTPANLFVRFGVLEWWSIKRKVVECLLDYLACNDLTDLEYS